MHFSPQILCFTVTKFAKWKCLPKGFDFSFEFIFFTVKPARDCSFRNPTMYRRRVLGVLKEDPCPADAISPTFKDVPSFGQTKACNAVSSPLANVQGCAGSPCTSRKMSGHQRCKSDGHSPRKERKQQRRMLHELHRCMAQSGLVAFSFSASALQRRMDSLAKLDEVSKFKSRRGGIAPSSDTSPLSAARFIFSLFCSYVVHCLALVSVLVHQLQEAIGESPLRRYQRVGETEGLDFDSAPLALFWAVNCLILCGLACCGLFTLSFLAQAFFTEDGLFSEEMMVVSEATTMKVLRLAFRIVMVAFVSFTSGMGLRVIHPIQSAMLCGI